MIVRMILVRKFREEMGISQAKLAEISGVPQQTISALESGAREGTTADTLYQLAHAFGRRMDELYVPDAPKGAN